MIILRTKQFTGVRKATKAAAKFAKASIKAAETGEIKELVDAGLKTTELKGLYRVPKTNSAKRGLRRVLTNTSNHTIKGIAGKDHEMAREIRNAYKESSQQLIDKAISEAKEVSTAGGKSQARKRILEVAKQASK